jgi:hypothetical protein
MCSYGWKLSCQYLTEEAIEWFVRPALSAARHGCLMYAISFWSKSPNDYLDCIQSRPKFHMF